MAKKRFRLLRLLVGDDHQPIREGTIVEEVVSNDVRKRKFRIPFIGRILSFRRGHIYENQLEEEK